MDKIEREVLDRLSLQSFDYCFEVQIVSETDRVVISLIYRL